MNTIITCSNCGAKNIFTRRFCGNCGAPLYSPDNDVNIRPERTMGITHTQSLLLGVLVIIVIIIMGVLVWQFGFNNKQAAGPGSMNVTIGIPGDYFQNNTTSSGPQISYVNTINVGDTTATIIWYTDVPSSSQVDYGRVMYSYGMLKPFAPQDDPTQGAGMTYHMITLSNLTPGATYYYRVRSRDIYGVETVSPDGTFFRTTKTLDFYSPD